MSGKMSEILKGLYIGDLKCTLDEELTSLYNISHIIQLFSGRAPDLTKISYLCIELSEAFRPNLQQYVHETNFFIHGARLKQQNVLVSCFDGHSLSVIVVLAYILTTTLSTECEARKFIRYKYPPADMKSPFMKQLDAYFCNNRCLGAYDIKRRFPYSSDLERLDRNAVLQAVQSWDTLPKHEKPRRVKRVRDVQTSDIVGVRPSALIREARMLKANVWLYEGETVVAMEVDEPCAFEPFANFQICGDRTGMEDMDVDPIDEIGYTSLNFAQGSSAIFFNKAEMQGQEKMEIDDY